MTPTAGRIPHTVARRTVRQRRVDHDEVGDSEGSRRALEEELERLRARVASLESEKAAIEMYAAVAAHELVEPLIITEAYAEIVATRLDPGEHADSRRDLDALARGAARMRRLVETLLHDARSADRPLELRPVDLNAVVNDCIAFLEPELQARGMGVEVHRLPEVHAEEPLVSGLFSNLLVNALKYSPRQGGTVRVGAAHADDSWRIWVQSEGPTIPDADRARIFEPFNRGRGERRVRGSGLGLAICRRIVERHGGQIGITGANGDGNVFYFTLPA
jgi:signal transduction histidine kinase